MQELLQTLSFSEFEENLWAYESLWASTFAKLAVHHASPHTQVAFAKANAVRCAYTVLGRGAFKYTVKYGATHKRLWTTLLITFTTNTLYCKS